MRDDETESLRVEQGKAPRPDPRDRQGDLPLAFSSGGVLASGADASGADASDADAPEGVAESADATRAVERGAAEIAAERRAGAEPADDQAPPSSRS
jgi:hypothetical protein